MIPQAITMTIRTVLNMSIRDSERNAIAHPQDAAYWNACAAEERAALAWAKAQPITEDAIGYRATEQPAGAM